MPTRAGAQLLLLLTGALVLAGCSSVPSDRKAKGGEAGEADAVVVSAQVQRDYGAALALLEAGDFTGASERLEALIAAQPTLLGPRVNLGIALSGEGEFEAAKNALLGAIELRPDAVEAWNQLGVVYRQMGRFLSARDAYEKAIAAVPDYALAHFNAAVLHDIYLHQPAEALVHYERYFELAEEPDDRVEAWIADMRRQVEAEQRTAGVVDEEF
ncbi:MAG: tetratricopeptide repeat protein [Pseudomonadota bacterium]